MLDEDPWFKQEIIDKITADSIDWQKFVAFCSNHLILPVIYLKFKSHDIIEYLPEELSEFLKEIYDLNLTRNSQILEQLQEITCVLNNGNIYPLFLKGAGNLLDGLYSDIGERMLGDIDILVAENDWLLSVELLENDGYMKTGEMDLHYEIHKHCQPIAKPGSPAYLEIHRYITEYCQSWFNPSITDKDKKTVTGLKGCYVLSDNHKIIHNFIHSQLDHECHLYGIVSLRDLYDLYLLSKRFSIKQTIVDIKCKQKAIAYFVFAGKAFGLNEKFYAESNFSAWKLIKIHDLNLSSATFYHGYRMIIYIFKRIFIGYIGQAIQFFYSQKIRWYVIKRLSDPKWYGKHIQTYISFFSTNK